VNRFAIFKTILGRTLIYIELLIVAVIVLYPLCWVIGSSLNPINSIARAGMFPDNATFENYRRLLQETQYLRWFRNTGYIAVMTMIFAVVLNTVTAFVFARFNFKGKKAALLFVMVLQTFPSFMGLIALYMIALNFGMLNNLNMLVIIYVAGTIPTNIWLIRGNLLNLPKSIDEAAYIDGASKLQVFAKIILPLSVPIISFIALTAFMAPWMDFMLPRFLINRTDTQTIAIGLFRMLDAADSNNYDFTAFCAGAVLIAIPIATLYMIGQKYLITGIASGANKGE
jgi:arabinogalactan oligomer/maltooligosaccharide transport system permease protein